jgi:hypothetical protein
MLNGSPPSNRHGRGPGVRWPIVTRALAYLDRSADSAPTPMRRPRPRSRSNISGIKTRSDADASDVPASIHDYAGMFVLI